MYHLLRKTLLLAALSAISFNSLSAQMTQSGDITSDETWSGTHTVTGDITVRDNVTLTVLPGTEIEFQGHYQLVIQGTIKALGEYSNRIVFTINDSTGWHDFSNAVGSWAGIRFYGESFMDDNDSSLFRNCTMQLVKSFDSPQGDDFGGAILVNYFDNVLVDSCYFFYNYAEYGGGGIGFIGSAAKVSNSFFLYNEAGSLGGAIHCSWGDPVIEGCMISNNHAPSGGAFKWQESNALLVNNFIVNNEADFNGGAGLMVAAANPVFINNTICNNKANNGGALYVSVQTKPEFYNNILWGNEANNAGSQIYFNLINPVIDFIHCDVEGGSGGFGMEAGSVFLGSMKGSFDLDPVLENPSPSAGINAPGFLYDWKIAVNSPCLNAGTTTSGISFVPETDFFRKDRVNFSYIDMGAHEYLDEILSVGPANYNTDAYWAADTVKVSGDIVVNNGATLHILPGTYIQMQGHHRIDIDGRLLAAGTAADTIVFSVKDTTGNHVPDNTDGGWEGIQFNASPTNDSSIISYARLEFGKRYVDIGYQNYGGVLLAHDHHKLRVSHSLFQYNQGYLGGVMRAMNSPVFFQACAFRHNYSTNGPGGVACHFSNVRFEDCRFEHNTTEVDGGAISAYLSNPSLHRCTIQYNTSGDDGGGIYSYYDSEPEILECLIRHNAANGRGGGLYLSGNPHVARTMIANNQAIYGGGIYAHLESSSVLTNNVIVNNNASLDGGGLSISGEGYVTNATIANNFADVDGPGAIVLGPIGFYNSIIWGNENPEGMKQVYIQGNGVNAGFHYSDIQGGVDSLDGWDFTGAWEQILDTPPDFMKPTAGTDLAYVSVAGDWALKSFSGLINQGTPDVSGLEVLPQDILDQPRIHAGIIDIGAAENQGEAPLIVKQPNPKFRCEGASAFFRVVTEDSVRYQWKKDGVIIAGATRSTLTIDEPFLADQGSYACEVSNAYGTATSTEALLIIKTAPEFLTEPESGWLQRRSLVRLGAIARGAEPIIYQWYFNGNELPGADQPELRIPHIDYPQEGVYHCQASNECGTTSTAEAALFVAPEICMVTVDTLTNSNLVVWEHGSSAPILHFNVYREGSVANQYNLLGQIPADSLTVFTDVDSDPQRRAYIYKITAVDTAGNESGLETCFPHKTMHLLVTVNPETKKTQLDWDEYVGFPYGTYYILRSHTDSNWTVYDSIAASGSTTYTDTEAGDEEYAYRVMVKAPRACLDPGGKKATTGPYTHALSNLDDNRQLQSTGIDPLRYERAVLYPNPAKDRATLNFRNPENKVFTLRIRDLTGKLVRVKKGIRGESCLIERGDLRNGYYHVELRGARRVYHARMILQ